MFVTVGAGRIPMKYKISDEVYIFSPHMHLWSKAGLFEFFFFATFELFTFRLSKSQTAFIKPKVQKLTIVSF